MILSAMKGFIFPYHDLNVAVVFLQLMPKSNNFPAARDVAFLRFVLCLLRVCVYCLNTKKAVLVVTVLYFQCFLRICLSLCLFLSEINNIQFLEAGFLGCIIECDPHNNK